jgi:hypothetical protein
MSTLSEDFNSLTAEQVREELKKQADAAHTEYVETKRSGGDTTDQAREAYKRWSVVDDARLRYDRALVSALQVLEADEDD